MSLIVCNRLLSHALPAGYITLIHDLTAENLRHEAVRHYGKKQDYTCINQDFLQQFLIHCLNLS